jgi:predicted RNase H-like HicB family nuclease
MHYRVILIPSDQGFAIGCPALPGCWSQGRTREEAKENIREAIRFWLEVAEEDARREAEAERGEIEEVVV